MPRKIMTEEERIQARKETQRKYNEKHRKDRVEFMKENYKSYAIRLNVNHDAQIIAFLDSKEQGYSQYIRNLIREDMENSPS